MTDWSTFTTALTRYLRDLPAGGVVIIEEAGPRSPSQRFVQFRHQITHLAAQLSADHHLAAEVRPDAAGHKLLIESGWQPPDSVNPDNWWRELAWPATMSGYHQLAASIVTALRDAYGIAGPDALQYYSWDEGDGNRPLDLPLLGVPRTAL